MNNKRGTKANTEEITSEQEEEKEKILTSIALWPLTLCHCPPSLRSSWALYNAVVVHHCYEVHRHSVASWPLTLRRRLPSLWSSRGLYNTVAFNVELSFAIIAKLTGTLQRCGLRHPFVQHPSINRQFFYLIFKFKKINNKN
jgi:hypothetical protein